MNADTAHVATRFFAAVLSLTWHTGSLPDRLADAYADHLLQVTADDLPEDLRSAFRALEERLNLAQADESEADDPFQVAARGLDEGEVRGLIESIVALYGRLAARALP